MGEVAPELYTQDGTVDIKGNPALKENTGNWRACPYILGTHHFFFCICPSILVLLLAPFCCNPLLLCFSLHRLLLIDDHQLQPTSAASAWPTTA
jgi:hypothetical protein